MDNLHSSRALGAFERMFWSWDQHRPNHFCVAAELEGTTTPDQWQRAMRALELRHPLLTARVVERGAGELWFEPDPAGSIPMRFVSLAASTWEAEASFELQQRFDAYIPPRCRLTLLEGGDRTIALFTAHHALLDGRRVSGLLCELLRLMAGEKLPPVPPTAPPEVVMADARQSVPVPPLPTPEKAGAFRPLSDRRARIERVVLSMTETAHLVTRCRKESTTVHGALVAAMLAAGRGASPDWLERPVRIATPVDIRPLHPSFQEAMGVYITPARMLDDSPHQAPFWELARTIKQNLTPFESQQSRLAGLNILASLAERRLGVEDAAALFSQLLPWDLIVTNLGRLNLATEFGALRLKAMWGPMVTAGFAGEQVLGAATLHGQLALVHTSYAPFAGLLSTAAGLLVQNSEP